MAEKTKPKQPEPVANAPEPDPTLIRRQQLREQYQQINGRIMELRQQKSLVKDMITDATIQAAEIRGALKEITQQKG